MPLPIGFRLSKRSWISRVLKTRLFLENNSFRLFFLKNSLKESRFSFVVSKKVSKRATLRNRLRRMASEWVRKNVIIKNGGIDAVIFLKERSVSLTKRDFYKELGEVFSRLRLL